MSLALKALEQAQEEKKLKNNSINILSTVLQNF
jgi:hypothetical protein